MSSSVIFSLLLLLLVPRLIGGYSGSSTNREHVRRMFLRGWHDYLDYAFPADELRPLLCKGRGPEDRERGSLDDTLGSFSLTLVDGLDTLAVMGEWKEFERGLNLIIENVSFGKNVSVSVFETTIRVLGGLLSCHVLAERFSARFFEPYRGQLLPMAEDLARRLLPAFETRTGIPKTKVNLLTGESCDDNFTTPAEGGTLLLEFGLLSALSKQPIFKNMAHRAVIGLWSRKSPIDLFGTTINVQNGDWRGHQSSLGAGGDSFFEYLLKAYIMFGKTEYLSMFAKAYYSIQRFMRKGSLFYPVNMNTGALTGDWMDGLQMFWPSIQVLFGDVESASSLVDFYWQVSRILGFPPEMFAVRNHRLVLADAGYNLRPELLESFLALYEATGDTKYLEFGQYFLDNLERHTESMCGYAAIADLRTKRLEDRLDSFFFSETLKYLFLLFDEDNFALDGDFLFSTQGHLFPVGARLDSAGDDLSLPSLLPRSATECAMPLPSLKIGFASLFPTEAISDETCSGGPLVPERLASVPGLRFQIVPFEKGGYYVSQLFPGEFPLVLFEK